MDIASINHNLAQPSGTARSPSFAAAQIKPTSSVIAEQDKTALQTANAEPEDIQQSIKALNDFMSSINRSSLNFSVDEESGRIVVKVMDKETNEVIKQIPSEEILAIAKAVDKLKGLLIQQSV